VSKLKPSQQLTTRARAAASGAEVARMTTLRRLAAAAGRA